MVKYYNRAALLGGWSLPQDFNPGEAAPDDWAIQAMSQPDIREIRRRYIVRYPRIPSNTINRAFGAAFKYDTLLANGQSAAARAFAGSLRMQEPALWHLIKNVRARIHRGNRQYARGNRQQISARRQQYLQQLQSPQFGWYGSGGRYRSVFRPGRDEDYVAPWLRRLSTLNEDNPEAAALHAAQAAQAQDVPMEEAAAAAAEAQDLPMVPAGMPVLPAGAQGFNLPLQA